MLQRVEDNYEIALAALHKITGVYHKLLIERCENNPKKVSKKWRALLVDSIACGDIVLQSWTEHLEGIRTGQPDDEDYVEVMRYSHQSWLFHCQAGSIHTGDDFHVDHRSIQIAARDDYDAPEEYDEDEELTDWSCEILGFSDAHMALAVGDAAFCLGFDSDVIIFRNKNKGE